MQEKNLSIIKADLYFCSRSEKEIKAENTNTETDSTPETKTKNNKLIFHIDHVTNIQWLCILPKIVTKIIAITYGDNHLEFNKCYKTGYVWEIVK